MYVFFILSVILLVKISVCYFAAQGIIPIRAKDHKKL